MKSSKPDQRNVEQRISPVSPRLRKKLQEALLAWFATAQRPLPWRASYHPYAVWVSEIMLQQTQVETALPYYKRWMESFPDVRALAAAPEAAVLKAWEGLGYYSRARSLRRAARQVVDNHGGVLPGCTKVLLALPGIGPYTAGAIASIAFNRDAAAVDGNIARVLSRLFALEAPVNTPVGQARLWELARELLPAGQARNFNQGLMELGALVCRAKSPGCSACPLRPCCAVGGVDSAGKTGRAEAFPRKSPPATRRQVRGVMLLPVRGQRLLMRRRPSGGLWGGLWEFPWLEQEPGESDALAVARLLEELGLSGHALPLPLGRFSHGLTHLQLELSCHAVQIPQTPRTPPGNRAAGNGAALSAGAPLPAALVTVNSRWVTPAARKKLALARLSHKALALWEGKL